MILLLTMWAVASCWGQLPVYYYQGQHKVQAEVETDGLVVKLAGPKSVFKVNASTSIAGLRTEAVPGLSMQAKAVLPGPASIAELNAQAAKLRQAEPGARVQALLRVHGSGADGQAKALTNRLSFRVLPSTDVISLMAAYGLKDVKAVDFADGIYTAYVDENDLLKALNIANQMQESRDAEWASPLVEEEKSKRLVPNDPIFPSQWHLSNVGTNTNVGVAGNDINVIPAWSSVTGAGVNIAIADDGVETTHPDLMANIRGALDYDFNDLDGDPGPLPADSHGTAVAGVAAGKGNNGIGVSGVAPDAGIVGLRILASAITDAEEGEAMAWRKSEPDPSTQVAVHSNSWGPSDDGKTLQGPGPLTEAAIRAGVTEGRNGKGIVYVWAAGNGRHLYDNINKDGYANSPYVIAVGASNSSGTFSMYSEPGAPMLVNAPSNDFSGGDGIFTTDVTGSAGADLSDYRPNFGGTSSAAPTVAGVAALMLQANPDLTYRDVMHILVESASMNNPADAGWKTNGAGREFNHSYGFGRVDAAAAVSAAVSWQNRPPLATKITAAANIPAPIDIPDENANGILLNIPVAASSRFVLEHVELEANITHTWRGDLAILLQSPSGMISEIVVPAVSADSNDNYSNWRFRSVAHWGENPSGTWRVLVADLFAADVGSIDKLTLRLSGYLAPMSSADLWTLY